MFANRLNINNIIEYMVYYHCHPDGAYINMKGATEKYAVIR